MRSKTTRFTVAAMAALLVLSTAACGDDDDDKAEDTGTTEADSDSTAATDDPAEGDSAAFCDAVIEFNGAVMNVELDDSSTPEDIKAVGEDLDAIFTTIVDNAPEALADTAGELHGAIEPLTEGDASMFNADSTFETYGQFVGQASEECEFKTVDVTGKDYAFEAPDSIEAGNVSFAFSNASEGEEHEMVLLRKGDGVDLSWDELLALPEEEAMSKAQFTAIAFAPPGGESSTLASLEAGDYAMVCFIPVGGGEDGPPHFTQGMVHELTVK